MPPAAAQAPELAWLVADTPFPPSTSGQKLRPTGGGCFLLPEDFDWGGQVYRRQEIPWQLG